MTTDELIHVTIHRNLLNGVNIYFKKFDKTTKINTIFEKVLDQVENVIHIHLQYSQLPHG